jgi:hypothetical protein
MESDLDFTPVEENQHSFDTEEKEEIVVIENVNDQADAVTSDELVQLKSEFDRLPIFKSVLLYRKTVLICAVAGFCASTDG